MDDFQDFESVPSSGVPTAAADGFDADNAMASFRNQTK